MVRFFCPLLSTKSGNFRRRVRMHSKRSGGGGGVHRPSPFRNRQNPLFAAVGASSAFVGPSTMISGGVEERRRIVRPSFIPFHFDRAQKNESIRAKRRFDRRRKSNRISKGKSHSRCATMGKERWNHVELDSVGEETLSHTICN